MSALRLLGLLAGLLGLVWAFFYFRGPRWSRSNFALSIALSCALVFITAFPSSVNPLRDILALGDSDHGRLIALLVVASGAMFGLMISTRAQVHRQKVTLDRLIRALGRQRHLEEHEPPVDVPEIMVVIPAYNEADNLPSLLPRIPKEICGLRAGVLLVDDASSDDTARVALSLGARVAQNPVNRGQGAASRLGYDLLKTWGVRYGITMDADGQHRPEDLPTMLEPVLQDRYDLIIGSRVLGGRDEDSGFRYAGVRSLSALINLLTGLRLTDCSSGFKAFSVKKIGTLSLVEEQFQAAEFLIEAAKRGLRVGEVPIYIHQRLHGESKKGTNLSYGLGFFKTIVKTWWR